MKKKDLLILLIITIIAIVFRLYKIDTPLADLHSWRQADTAAVARNFARDGINLIEPRYDDLTSIESGIENPKGLRFVEFPVYNAIFALFYRYLPILPIEVYGRLTSVFFSVILIWILYYFALKEHGRAAGIFTASVYAIFPFFVFFSRVVLPETTALSMMFVSIFFIYLYLKKQNQNIAYLVMSIIFYALALLVKPTTIFYSLAIGYLFIVSYKFDLFKKWQPYAYVVLGLIPFIAWRLYIMKFPEGIPASDLLFMYVNTFEGPKNIFFKPAFFRWIFMERVGIAMFGIFLSSFFIVGIIAKTKKYFLHSIFFSSLVYLFTFQGGNVQHEYYQTIALPGFALMTGLGIAHTIRMSPTFVNKLFFYPTLIVLLVFSFFFSYYRVKDYYNYPRDLTQVAKLIMTFTKPEDKIVTDRIGDTTLLYLADRKGAPAVYKEVEELVQLGYSYLVTDKKDFAQNLKEKGYQVLVENDQFSLVKLK